VSSLEMIFRIIAKDGASPAFKSVGESAKLLQRTVEEANAKIIASQRVLAEQTVVATSRIERAELKAAAASEKAHKARRDSLMKVGATSALILGAVAVESLKMAMNFQTVTNQLVTSAGESTKNIDLVRKGLLEMSGQVGVSAIDLAKGMYQVESAGFHGARGLDVMRAATEGAKAEGADMETVAKALTTVLNDYGTSIGGNAVKGTNFLIESVSLGKTRLQDFSAAISSVLLPAKSAGISLAEVGGAMSTMTSEGITADNAATYLRQTIVKLADQTPKAKNEMKALGLESIDVAGHLGQRGLAGTLQVLTDAIAKHLGPKGLVMLDSLKHAGQNADKFQVALSNLPPAAQTYIGALTTMVGGQKTMMGALALTGEHMKTFKDDTVKISESMVKAGPHVNGFALVQQSLRGKLDDVKGSMSSMAIELGNVMLPVATKFFGYLAGHTKTLRVLAEVIGGVLVAATVAWGIALFSTGVGQVVLAITALGIGLVELITHFRQVTDFLHGPWGTAISVAVAVMLPIVGLPMLLIGHWKEVSKFFFWLWHNVSDSAQSLWHAAGGFFSRMWHDVSGFAERIWHDVTGFFARIAHDVMVPLRAIASFVGDHWRLLLTIFTGGAGLILVVIIDHWKAITNLTSRLWHDVTGFFSRIWNDVTGWVSRMWNDVFGTTKKETEHVTGTVSAHVGKVTGWFSRLWNDVTGWVSRLWHDVAGFFSRIAADVWAIISPFIDRLVRGWTRIYDATMSVVRPLWHDVSDIFGRLADGAVAIFERMARGIGRIWDTVKGLVATPINWVIRFAYNDGILKLIHGLGSVLHEPSMSDLAPMQELHFATGGVIPGSHNRDTVPFFGTPGEVVVPKSAVAAAGGAGSLMRALGFGGSGGAGGHYGVGGVIHGIGSAVAGAVGDAAHVVAHPLDALKDIGHMVLGALGATAGPIIHGLESTADSILGGMGGVGHDMALLVHVIGDKLLSFVSGKDSAAAAAASSGGATGGKYTGAVPTGSAITRWAPLVLAVLGELGLSGGLVGKVLTQIGTESGGDPNATQGNIGDVNNATGDLARGLLQVIGTTFRANAGPYLSLGQYNPHASIYAGLHYAEGRYGPDLSFLGQGHGYATGGMPPVGVPYWTGEKGPELRVDSVPGRILSHADSMKAISGRNAPLVGTVHIYDNVGLELLLQQAQFRESAGHFG